jgi:chromosomal replication initiator protein
MSILETEIPTVTFDVWIKTLQPVGIADDKLILMAPTISNKNLVANRYADAIREALSRVHATLNDVDFISSGERDDFLKKQEGVSGGAADSPPPYAASAAGAPAPLIRAQGAPMLNPKYTFDTFVVGKSNQFVAAAARAVAENPAAKFNPLFVYGGVGLGKTHLMHAIGNFLKSERPELKVMYVSCERFMNELIDAIRGGKERGLNQEFREKYRSLDVLMVDDIQFIANKTSTQEEFFHTFNDLYQNNRQIIISSDRPPKEIAPLEERLRTRFEWGMTADIQPPDLETRIAIIQKKAAQEKYNVSNEVLSLIAEKVQSNIREMEGLLSRVVFYASLTGRAANDIDMANEALKDYLDDKKESINADSIIDAVCLYYSVDRAGLIGKKKNKEIVDPRQICIYLITEFLSLPLTSIGQIFGGRDHTTIMHARDKISALTREDGKTATQIKDLKNIILNI